MEMQSRIYVAGHSGMVGTALMNRLSAEGYSNVITRDHINLDLACQHDVEEFFSSEKPEYVFLLAARVGGIADNRDHPADALITNSLIALNVIRAAFENGVERLIFAASSTIYPEASPQPMREGLLLTGPFESYWEGYALAKTLGVKLCEYLHTQYHVNYCAAVLPNLYGPNDKGSTVLPMLIEKFYEARIHDAPSVEVWGTGTPRREFLHADDLADALVFLAKNHKGGGHINVGYGSDISIRELAELIKKISGFRGEIVYNTSKPDGTKQKLLDSTKLHSLGWAPNKTLTQGVAEVFQAYAMKRRRLGS